MSALSSFWHQSFFLPQPTLTESNLPNQLGRVAIITGGYAGVGFELAKIIYQRNGTVYIAGRNSLKAGAAISKIQTAHPDSKGRLEFLQLDLSDLSTIKGSAKDFLKREQRLDVLTNNAGVGQPPAGSTSAQGYELQMATNCLGPFLFTKLLLPVLRSTPGARVTWAGSLTIDMSSPSGGITLNETGAFVLHPTDTPTNYGASKAGNLFLASELARRYPEGLQVNAFNPGNLRTELTRHLPGFVRWLLSVTMLYPAVYGGYTELFAGWSEEAGKPEHNGGYVIPWGRFGDVRKDVQQELGKEGGVAEKFWEWCERETEQYC